MGGWNDHRHSIDDSAASRLPLSNSGLRTASYNLTDMWHDPHAELGYRTVPGFNGKPQTIAFAGASSPAAGVKRLHSHDLHKRAHRHAACDLLLDRMRLLMHVHIALRERNGDTVLVKL